MLISRQILTVFFLGFVLLVSCSKDETSPTQTDNFTKVFTANIDGTAWDGSSNATVQKSGSTTTISGTAANGQKINLELNGNLLSGFTTIGIHKGQVIEQPANVWTSSISSVTIDTVTSTVIQGKFQFIASPSSGSGAVNRTVTDGKFSLKF